MKRITSFPRTLALLSFGTAAVVWFNGCSTPPEHSYNADFGAQLPVQPMYFIEDEDDRHFLLTVQQGKPSTGVERISNVKEAASAISKAECQRLGWEKWQMNYIQEQNQGWMHVVKAEVKREPYSPPTFPTGTTNQ